ncbi:DNA replication protein DnaC [Eubacterium ruminantium]|nr:DNA replication protein DnaC [Eubacterium ruminantium]
MSYTFDMDEILKQLDRRRSESKRELSKRREEVYEKIPEIKEIEDEIREGTLDTIRRGIAEKSADGVKNISELGKLQKKNDELTRRKKNLLVKNGYDEAYLERQYVCPKCKDEGYFEGRRCSCLNQMIVEARYMESNLSSRLSQENFETFDYSFFSKDIYKDNVVSPYDNIKNLVERAKNYIKSFDKSRGNIIIFGETGRGKTFLTNCIAKEILDAGFSVFYLTAGEMVEDVINEYLFRHTEGEDDRDKKARYDFIFKADLLIIDDLGTEALNRQSITHLFRVVNERITRGKATIISSNLDIKGIRDNYTERFAGRIAENYDFYNIFGANIRMVKKKRMLEKYS